MLLLSIERRCLLSNSITDFEHPALGGEQWTCYHHLVLNEFVCFTPGRFVDIGDFGVNNSVLFEERIFGLSICTLSLLLFLNTLSSYFSMVTSCRSRSFSLISSNSDVCILAALTILYSSLLAFFSFSSS